MTTPAGSMVLSMFARRTVAMTIVGAVHGVKTRSR